MNVLKIDIKAIKQRILFDYAMTKPELLFSQMREDLNNLIIAHDELAFLLKEISQGNVEIQRIK